MILLPDVNVLVALIWESHVHHAPARQWFAENFGGNASAPHFATCSITQSGFVRVSSNPKALKEAISVREATAVLAVLMAHPRHRFLTDDRGYVGNPLVPHDKLIGHRQVTDAHILAIARRHRARVVTLDTGMAGLGGSTVQPIPIA